MIQIVLLSFHSGSLLAPSACTFIVQIMTIQQLLADTVGQDRPSTPPPIQVDRTVAGTTSSQQPHTSYSGMSHTRVIHPQPSQPGPVEEQGAIMFTKPQPQVSNFHLPTSVSICLFVRPSVCLSNDPCKCLDRKPHFKYMPIASIS